MFQFHRCSSSSSNVVSLIGRHRNASTALPPPQALWRPVAPLLPPRGMRSSTSVLCRTNHTTATTVMNHSSRRVLPHQQPPPQFQATKCQFSTSSTSTSAPSWLEGDIGTLGTKIYHSLNLGLAVMVPIYFITPERYANGYINKTVGFLMATGISVHSFIGLNYVCRDYVPKLSSKLLGPARIVTAAFSILMFLGMSKIALYSPNGIKGIIAGLWTKPKTENDEATHWWMTMEVQSCREKSAERSESLVVEGGGRYTN